MINSNKGAAVNLNNYIGNDINKSTADVLSSKIGQDEEDETAIFELQNQLNNVKGKLDQAKFKYEQRQLYELDQQETRLVKRLQAIEEYKKENNNYDQIREQIRLQKQKRDSLNKQEKELEVQMWKVEREKRMQEIAKKKLELERIKEQNSLFAEIERKKKVELEVIDDKVKL